MPNDSPGVFVPASMANIVIITIAHFLPTMSPQLRILDLHSLETNFHSYIISTACLIRRKDIQLSQKLEAGVYPALSLLKRSRKCSGVESRCHVMSARRRARNSQRAIRTKRACIVPSFLSESLAHERAAIGNAARFSSHEGLLCLRASRLRLRGSSKPNRILLLESELSTSIVLYCDTGRFNRNGSIYLLPGG